MNVNAPCPYCATTIHTPVKSGLFLAPQERSGYPKTETDAVFEYAVCPNCHKHIVWVVEQVRTPKPKGGSDVEMKSRTMCYPIATGRPPLAVEVTDPDVRKDYEEAAKVLQFSPRASAALSRRCLQFMVRTYGNVKKDSLDKEITEAAKALPSDIASLLDAIRQAGNLSAHPMFDKATGLVVDVEPDEAEHLLDLLDLLIDHYLVAPARRAVVQAKINGKYKNAKK